MKVPQIKFSKHYKKLPSDADGRFARLLAVHKVSLQHQAEWFLKYDTEAVDGTHYPLPKQGEFLFLLFELENGGLFTTLRRWTCQKEGYYLGKIGCSFEVVVTDTL